MTLKESDLSKLIEIQDLCSQVEDDIITLRKFQKFLINSEKRRNKLSNFYSEEWLRLIESSNISKEQKKEIEVRVKKGRFSIFWQDVIWNAISDLPAERVRILKKIARML